MKMKNKKTTVQGKALIVVLLFIVGIIAANTYSMKDSFQQINSDHDFKLTASPSITMKNNGEAPADAVVTDRREDQLSSAAIENFKTPDLVDYLEQVKADPHGTPKVVFEFSFQMAKLMMDALKSPQLAALAFSRLDACARSREKEEIPAVAASCFTNAGRLYKAYPHEFREKFEDMNQAVSERLRIFRNFLET